MYASILPSTRRPRWQPDDEVAECPDCQSSFGVLRRKHHCRACGRVVCNSCSKHRSAIIPMGYMKPVRVCHNCTMMHSSRTETPPHSLAAPKFPRSPYLRSKNRNFGTDISNSPTSPLVSPKSPAVSRAVCSCFSFRLSKI